MDPSSSYTCITCHVAFKAPDMQREHYRSDWHRYNLKRKVSELPPVSAESFQQKVLTQKNLESTSKEDKSVYCTSCHKAFGNQNSYDNHLNSKKHKDNEKNADKIEPNIKTEDEEMEEVDSDEWEDDSENLIDKNDCMFCLKHHKNFIKNLEHMTVAHSFFIPDIEYCTDVYGLLKYLAEKIEEGFMCLWCNEKGRTFHSASAARKHMLDKGHCRMLHEGAALAEYTDYYDYTSSYPDYQKADPNEEVDMEELDATEFELVLPSGATIGHRSLMRYYKQSVNPDRSLAVCKNKKVNGIFATYRALGWEAGNKEVVAKRARDIHYMKRMQAKLRLKLGVKSNKLQKSVRLQIN